MKKALLFPGQGSQTVGMGKELAEQFPAARAVFDEVDGALSQKLSSVIFDGPQEILTLTENAQPAIMATSIAALRVLEKETGFSVREQAAFVLGHSLGEYSALCAAGALTLSDTAKLLRLRGQAMQRAMPAGQGAMAALLGADYALAKEIADEAARTGVCVVANDNAPGQVVVSGAKAAVERACEIAKSKGVKRAVLLDVSAPFHCPLMAPAAQAMKEALASAKISAPCVPLVTNVTASAESNPDVIRRLLVEQVTGMVRWRESILYIKDQGVTRAIEIGAGKVLAGLNKRIAPEMETSNVGIPADLAAMTGMEH
ncbi:MAG: ACP S-malonyltransferase [Pseudomonadota bacterium]|nr:ACP S-malonyltransferase [Pseudomonadota bacterium]MDE3038636.1 ACP S-malonyltransferase [Pseudomonadota bacterium]